MEEGPAFGSAEPDLGNFRWSWGAPHTGLLLALMSLRKLADKVQQGSTAGVR